MERGQRKGVPDGTAVEINERVWFVDHDGFRVVFRGWNTPLFRISVEDKQEVRAVAVWLRTSGHATQDEIAGAFGHSIASQRRWEFPLLDPPRQQRGCSFSHGGQALSADRTPPCKTSISRERVSTR